MDNQALAPRLHRHHQEAPEETLKSIQIHHFLDKYHQYLHVGTLLADNIA